MANEKRLIDLDATLNRLEKESWWLDSVKSCIRMFLAKAKLVDAVEVVRCKECRFSVQHDIYDPMECMKWKTKWGVAYTTPDGHCHKGERKDNG